MKSSSGIPKALFKEIEEYQEEAQPQQEQVEPPPPQKRPRSEGISQQAPQAFGDEPPWVGQMFDRMSLMESNFNSRMDTMESNFNMRFTYLDENIAHLQYDIHHIYEQQGYTCTFSSFVLSPPPSPPPT